MSTYTPIATQTANGSVSSLAFSSIPQGYTDLVLVFQGKVDSGSGDLGLRFNSDTDSNYSVTWLSSQAGGTSGRSTSATSITATEYAYLDSTGFTLSTINFQNYSNATTYKNVLARSSKANYQVEAKVGLWRNTNAITSITVFTTGSGPAFTSGSTFSLYGIQVGQAAQKAQGGNIVASSGGYVYHAYTSSGTFIPNAAISADILVIGGGGGGGAFHGGGGGGGAIEGSSFFQTQSLTAKSYTVTIGAGGAGGTVGGRGNNGGNSLFGGTSTITALGGGAGGSAYVVPTGGGSGGGTGQSGHSAGTASGSNTNAGGTSAGNGQGGGGGGGATAAGANANNNTAGAGGQGKTLTTIDSNFTALGFAGIVASSGGGGGSEGGTAAGGGTGAGAGTNSNTAGGNATSFGSGGGGGGYTTGDGGNGGNGYSGLVIIRYAV